MTEGPTLDDKAAEFATTLTALTRGVLGEDSPAFSALNVGDRVQVAPFGPDRTVRRIPVRINGEVCLQLVVTHFCCWDAAGKFLATDKAEVHVHMAGQKEQLFRYEYERRQNDPPGAHVHVHAHRDELAYLLRLADRKQSRPGRAMKKREFPRLSEIHWSVGGHRMRPALEDVLLLLKREFDIDTVDGWQQVIKKHLREWRELQLKAAVRDAHESAAEVLRELGYRVEAPVDIEPQSRESRLYRP